MKKLHFVTDFVLNVTVSSPAGALGYQRLLKHHILKIAHWDSIVTLTYHVTTSQYTVNIIKYVAPAQSTAVTTTDTVMETSLLAVILEKFNR
ncbi:hypothetical protein [uncultured Ruthenibacterium sp.]|uniref:hypothetical protein n=1 Tax=uncultured Ruthenibacterium sp. TaxID=1905347 RepID=UPI00349EA209